jgi:hypothetical protein
VCSSPGHERGLPFGPPSFEALRSFWVPKMTRLPLELLELILHTYCDNSPRAKPPNVFHYDFAIARRNAKPAWADIAPLLETSRMVRDVVMQRWLSTLFICLPPSEAALDAILTFPSPRFAQWVR